MTTFVFTTKTTESPKYKVTKEIITKFQKYSNEFVIKIDVFSNFLNQNKISMEI